MRIHPRYRFLIIISTLLAIITTSLTVATLPSLQPQIPLWYTFTVPSQSLTSKWWILILPLGSLVFNASIVFLLLVSKRIDDFMIRMYAWSTILNQGILLVALVRILAIL